MKFLETMLPYFQGEKLEALIFILPIRFLCFVFGAWLLSEAQPGFFKGVSIPFIAMGLALTIVGATVSFRTPDQTLKIQQSYKVDQAATIKSEIVRMDKVNKAWNIYLTAWLIFTIVGLGLRFLTHSEFLRGIGVALVFFAGIGLMIDGFAERRARIYFEALVGEKNSN